MQALIAIKFEEFKGGNIYVQFAKLILILILWNLYVFFLKTYRLYCNFYNCI
jgi:hypothetical protein